MKIIKFFNLQRYGRAQTGTTAIEFSLLAVPFCLTVIAIIELSLMFAGGFVLQGAVNDAVRLIRTGQIQQASGDPETMFHDALCRHATVLLNCNQIKFSVQTLADFNDSGAAATFDENGNMVDTSFDPGGVRDVVMVQVSYLYGLMTPFLSRMFSDYPGNKKLLTSVVVIETEPYNFENQV